MSTAKLSFLPPTENKDVMVVEELLMNLEEHNKAPFKVSRWEVYPDKSSPIDTHEVRECWFIARGKGELIRNGVNEGIVSQGDVLFFDSYQSHSIHNIGIENLLVFSTWWNAK
ncbi:cupin domain-containing protein [Aquimarina sediminis]|uniref:cupin domain-containing protein n=1 Tax=Aquimarina sediminis TaxID=2070536 RepID=UPI000CA01D53|nr:cupin domain-containing protein [Aquimarina sediminis]